MYHPISVIVLSEAAREHDDIDKWLIDSTDAVVVILKEKVLHHIRN